MGKDETGTLARAIACAGDIIDPTITACRGRIVKTTGDGMLPRLCSIVDETRCAILIQRGVRSAMPASPESERCVSHRRQYRRS